MSGGRTPARRWVMEAAVIVGSILVAFAIDAWWDERREGEAREALYEAYQSDIAAMRDELERVRGHHVGALSATRELMALRDRPALTETDAERVDSLVAAAMWGSSFDAPAGAASTIVSTDDLSYLRNPGLIAASNQLLAQIASLEREQQEMAVELNAVSLVLTEEGVDMADIWDFSTIVAGDGDPVPSTRRTAAWRVVTRLRVRSALSELFWQYNNTVQILSDIEALLTRIEGSIESAR